MAIQKAGRIMVLRFFVFGLSVAFLMGCSSTPENTGNETGQKEEKADGKKLFNIHCAACHKYNGKGGVSGAKDLTISSLSRDEIGKIVSNGSGDMMPFKEVLTPEEIQAVIDHVQTLQN